MASLKRKGDLPTGSREDLKRPKKDGSLTSFFGAPKPAGNGALKSDGSAPNGSAPEPTPVRFNKDAWVSSLKPEQKELLKLEIDTLDTSWLAHLKEELVSTEFLNLKRFLQKEIDSKMTVFPPLDEVYSWSRHTPLHTVKVVILGQDPYHKVNQAHGLSFSVRPPTPAPPSLLNIYKALKHDYPSWAAPANKGGLLTPWANQGVLMLNTCLTVRSGEANSHANKGWEKFTQKIIDVVVKVRSRGVVFLAWGNPAQKRCASIKTAKHLVLKGIHPSPLAQTRGSFTECGHFKATNKWLEERYGGDGQIDWNLNWSKPIAAPAVQTPVKVTETQQKTSEVAGPVTEVVQSEAGNPIEDDFEDIDDEDALEALQAVERSSAAGGD